MVGVVPTPVRGPSVVVKQYPLSTLKILLEHLLLGCDALWSKGIEVYFGLVIELFRCFAVLSIDLYEVGHKLEVIGFSNFSKLSLGLGQTIHVALSVAFQSFANKLVNVTDTVIWNLFRLQVGEVRLVKHLPQLKWLDLFREEFSIFGLLINDVFAELVLGEGVLEFFFAGIGHFEFILSEKFAYQVAFVLFSFTFGGKLLDLLNFLVENLIFKNIVHLKSSRVSRIIAHT